MKTTYFLRAVSLLALLVSLVPVSSVSALPLADPPPVGMFQLPWDLGIAWVAIDGLDNGTRRPLNSSHHFSVGGAIDFAPHNNMRLGEDTSRFWVAAAASGIVSATSFCHVKIDHGNGWTSESQFLANIQVKVGDNVSRNQRLGILADGVRQKFCPGSKEPNVPHVHFMLRPSLRNATLAGWEINYLPILSKTTFRKSGQTVGLFKPLLNTFDQVQIVLRGPITWDTLYSGNVDAFRYERWSLTLNELNKFTLTATPTTSGLTPLIFLLDANGVEITRSAGTLTSTQPAGNYFVQIQPQAGSGSYTLLLQRNDLPAGPFVSTIVSPASVNIGQTATATVSLNNVPSEGYTSTEFTCTYNATLAAVSNIVAANLFGADPAVAISNPQNGSFIVAIAGSQGNKATASGTAFTFSLTGSQAGQTAVECKARVSKGDNVLTSIDFIPGSLTVLSNTSTPTPGITPTVPVETPVPTETPSPVPNTPTATPVEPGNSPTPSATPGGPTATPTWTATPTIPVEEWLVFTNNTYQFRFLYPPGGQIVPGGNDNSTRINLPFTPGTNLSEKYLQMTVAENANPCRSPLATSSIPQTSETVVINGITFLKETGEDGTAGHINKWTAYSTVRGIACVSLDFVLRAANPDVFPTPPPLYDEAAESLVFGQIVSTFQWLDGSSTSTPTPAESPTPTSSTPVGTVTPTSSTPVESPTPTSSTPVGSPTPTGLPNGTITGKVIASKPITVSLYNASNQLVTSVTANPDGTFSLTAPAGTYTITATASGFLRAQGSVTISGATTKPTLSLLAGDIDGNDVIDQFDALTIGMSYNSATPSAADLNNDGVINVLDLELLATNYRKIAPQEWN
jgi:murein DD-endopeptidase MepM/ murein hydrolase activator NlpD